MGFFDPPVDTGKTYGDEIMAAHAAAHPQYSGPEVATDGTGNRYPLPDADGNIVVWPGATTLAKELDNPWPLFQWQLRQTAFGMGKRPDLVAQAGACQDPDTDRKTLSEVVGQAQHTAAVSSGANWGKALHMAFERVDRGEPIENLPEMFHADIKARQAKLAELGITILPEYRERVVRCLIFKVSGRLDGIARLSDGSIVVFDDKSEKDPVSYPHSKTVQTSMYANAGELWNPYTNTIEPMPDVRKDFALIIHSRPGEAMCEVYRVNIMKGWAAARLAVEIREWRRTEGLIAPYVPDLPGLPSISSVAVGFNVLDKEREFGPSADAVESASQGGGFFADDPTESCSQCTTFPDCLCGEYADAHCEVCKELKCPTCDQCVGGQCPRSACECEIVSEPGQPEQWEPPPMGTANGQKPDGTEDEIARLAAKMTKPQLQAMCESVGITDVAHHRAWLAKEYVEARNKLGKTEAEMDALRSQSVRPVEQQVTETAVGTTVEPETVFDRISNAESKQELADIWNAWVAAGNSDSGDLAQQVMKAGLDQLKVIQARRPVTVDNPFS